MIDEKIELLTHELQMKCSETIDDFIFSVCESWCNDRIQYKVSKQELIAAIGLYRRIVCCKDCKYGIQRKRNGTYICDLIGFEKSPEHYCADGVKRDE